MTFAADLCYMRLLSDNKAINSGFIEVEEANYLWPSNQANVYMLTFTVQNLYMDTVNRPLSTLKLMAFSFPVAGLWIGFLISVSVQAVFFTGFLNKLNWKEITEEVGKLSK